MCDCVRRVVWSNIYELVCAGPLRWSHMSWVSPHMCPSPPVITRYWLLFTNITKHWNCLCNYVPWQPSDKEHLCGSERIFLVETFQGNGMGSPICHWFVKKNIITELCWWRSNDKLKMNYWTQLAVISYILYLLNFNKQQTDMREENFEIFGGKLKFQLENSTIHTMKKRYIVLVRVPDLCFGSSIIQYSWGTWLWWVPSNQIPPRGGSGTDAAKIWSWFKLFFCCFLGKVRIAAG